jgi:hypothetical protein
VVFGIIGMMKVDVVMKEPSAHSVVTQLVTHQRLPNDITRCVMTAVRRKSVKSGSRDDI